MRKRFYSLIVFGILMISGCRFESMFFPQGIYNDIIEEELSGNWLTINYPEKDSIFESTQNIPFEFAAHCNTGIQNIYLSLKNEQSSAHQFFVIYQTNNAVIKDIIRTYNTNLAVGKYEAAAYVMDNNGDSSQIKTLNFEIKNPAPSSNITITINNPSQNQTISNSSFTVSGTASSTDTNISTVYVQMKLSNDSVSDTEWQLANGTSNWNYIFDNLISGNYTIYAHAYDSLGNMSMDTSVHIVVVTSNTTTTSNYFYLQVDSPPYGQSYIDTDNIIVSGKVWALDTICCVEINHKLSNETQPNDNLWTNATLTAGTGGTNDFYFQYAPFSIGNYDILISAIDNNSRKSDARSIPISVNASNTSSTNTNSSQNVAINISYPSGGDILTTNSFNMTGTAYADQGLMNIYFNYDLTVSGIPATFNTISFTGTNWQQNLSGLTDGDYTAYVFAVDSNSVTSPTNSVNFTIDAVPDVTASITSPANGTIISSDALTVTGTATAVAGLDIVEVALVPQSLGNPSTSDWVLAFGTSNWSNTYSLLPSDNYNIFVRASDINSAVSEIVSNSITIDSMYSKELSSMTYYPPDGATLTTLYPQFYGESFNTFSSTITNIEIAVLPTNVSEPTASDWMNATTNTNAGATDLSAWIFNEDYMQQYPEGSYNIWTRAVDNNSKYSIPSVTSFSVNTNVSYVSGYVYYPNSWDTIYSGFTGSDEKLIFTIDNMQGATINSVNISTDHLNTVNTMTYLSNDAQTEFYAYTLPSLTAGKYLYEIYFTYDSSYYSSLFSSTVNVIDDIIPNGGFEQYDMGYFPYWDIYNQDGWMYQTPTNDGALVAEGSQSVYLSNASNTVMIFRSESQKILPDMNYNLLFSAYNLSATSDATITVNFYTNNSLMNSNDLLANYSYFIPKNSPGFTNVSATLTSPVNAEYVDVSVQVPINVNLVLDNVSLKLP